MRMIMVLGLACVLATPTLAAPSVNLNWKEECYRDAAVYLKLLRMVMDRKVEDAEAVSPRLRAEFARTMRTAKQWKTAISDPRNRGRTDSRRAMKRGEARDFVTRLKRRIRTCHALLPG
jgi:hypothetical protein